MSCRCSVGGDTHRTGQESIPNRSALVNTLAGPDDECKWAKSPICEADYAHAYSRMHTPAPRHVRVRLGTLARLADAHIRVKLGGLSSFCGDYVALIVLVPALAHVQGGAWGGVRVHACMILIACGRCVLFLYLCVTGVTWLVRQGSNLQPTD